MLNIQWLRRVNKMTNQEIKKEVVLERSSLSFYFIYIAIGFLLACSLFLVLAHITSSPVVINSLTTSIPHFNLFMNKQVDDVKTISRALPPPVELALLEKTQTKTVQKKVNSSASMNVEINLNLPNISANNDIELSPMGDLLDLADVELTIDNDPDVISQFPPQYPAQALRSRLEGSVTIDFVINTIGRAEPDSMKIVESKPNDIFDNAVKRAIKRWRFKVKKVNGKAISFSARKTLTFKLDN